MGRVHGEPADPPSNPGGWPRLEPKLTFIQKQISPTPALPCPTLPYPGAGMGLPAGLVFFLTPKQSPD